MNNKFQKSMLLIYIITFVVSIIGATYAYFTVIKVNVTSPEVVVTSAVTEVISFSIDDKINIYADYSNFQEGMDNLISSANAVAYMRFDGGTRVVEHLYDIIFEIDDNSFVYTTEDEKVELLLKVMDPNGNAVKEIPGLTYIEDKEGFDITTKAGKYFIANEYLLATDSEVTQTWKVSVTFVNLDVEQIANYDKEFNAHLLIQRSENDYR